MKILMVVLIVVIVFLQYRLWFADDGLIHIFHLKNNIRAQQTKNDNIVKHNAALIEEVNSLKKGVDAIENRARNDLGMVKKGEVFYQIVK